MYVYEKKSVISCSVEELYEFHADPKNLPHITPDGIKVTILNEKIETKEGFVINMKVKDGLLTLPWSVRFLKVKPPNMIVDEALQSPFSFWRHEHIFESLEDGKSLLHDRVSYELPFGMLGRMLNFVVHYKLDKMFRWRHAKTDLLLHKR